MGQRLSPQNRQAFSGLNQVQLIRLFDIFICVLVLPWLLPLFSIIAVAIKLTSPGPVFFRSKRVGQQEELFDIYKFRTMYDGANRKGPAITVNNDPRITPVGGWLRRHKLDELPQLINVLKGDMSLVGPRPESPHYTAIYSEEQRRVLSVRPGLTSPASLYYIHEEALLSGADWESTYTNVILPRKLAMDAIYVQHYTLQNYLSILFATVVAVMGVPRIVEQLSQMRNRHILILDILFLILTPIIALAYRLELPVWSVRIDQALMLYILTALAVKLLIFYPLGLYRRYWQYASLSDLKAIVLAVGLATLLLFSFFAVDYHTLELKGLAVYRSLPLLDGLLTGVVVTTVRLSLRIFVEWRRQSRSLSGGRRVLIIGAGNSGKIVLSEIRANHELGLAVVAFVDDDPAKIGTRLLGVPVVASTREISRCVNDYNIQKAIIAMPSAPKARQKQVAKQCKSTGVETYDFPGIADLIAGHKTVSLTSQIDVNQLLQRQPVVADKTEISHLLADATVLVTGAGGSIGRELCRQIAQFKPAQLLLLGHGENSIFEIGMELQGTFPDLQVHQIIADVRDANRINQIVNKYRPKIIYHAAAHKHVPLMQTNIEEVVTNNVLGTRTVLRAAEQYGVEHFILISTDKAINPTNMMGASKRIAELLVKAAAYRSGRAYKAVRFGNVLGSRGSVIPLFLQQIAAGGPIKITHPEMTRYFMTIPEAVQLVLQATVVGQSSDIFVLDMGKPVRILDLAKDLLKMSGIKLDEIDIVFSGIRPGEKLYEELFQTTEQYKRTKYEKIFEATENGLMSASEIEDAVAQLITAAQQATTEEVIRQIKQLIPTYQPEAKVQPTPIMPKPEALNGYPPQRELVQAPVG